MTLDDKWTPWEKCVTNFQAPENVPNCERGGRTNDEDHGYRAGEGVQRVRRACSARRRTLCGKGLDLQFARPQPGDLRSTAEGTLANPVTNQGRLLERGEARMFQG